MEKNNIVEFNSALISVCVKLSQINILYKITSVCRAVTHRHADSAKVVSPPNYANYPRTPLTQMTSKNASDIIYTQSSLLLNIYGEYAMRITIKEW